MNKMSFGTISYYSVYCSSFRINHVMQTMLYSDRFSNSNFPVIICLGVAEQPCLKWTWWKNYLYLGTSVFRFNIEISDKEYFVITVMPWNNREVFRTPSNIYDGAFFWIVGVRLGAKYTSEQYSELNRDTVLLFCLLFIYSHLIRDFRFIH